MAKDKQSKRSPKEGYKRFEINLPERVVDEFTKNVERREGSAYYRTRVLQRIIGLYNSGSI